MTFSFLFFTQHLFSFFSLITFYLQFDLLLPNRNYLLFLFFFLFSYIFFFGFWIVFIHFIFIITGTTIHTHTHIIYIFLFFFSLKCNCNGFPPFPSLSLCARKKTWKKTKEYKITWLLALFCYQPYLSEPPAGNQYMLVFLFFFLTSFDVFDVGLPWPQCHLEKTNRSNVTNHPVCNISYNWWLVWLSSPSSSPVCYACL